MSDHNSNFEVRVSSERSFGIVFAVVFALIGLFPLLGGGSPRWIVLAIAALFLALAFFAPSLLTTPNRWWFKLGMLLAAITAPIVMALVFFVVFLPIGLLVRASGKDLLSQKRGPESESYWIDRDQQPKTMKLQY